MLHIDGLDLTNVISFKEVSVDFKSTLTYVRGVNKDSDLARPTGNGTGKSLFFSAIPNVWFSAAPLSLRKKSRKDMLVRKGSSIGMIYRPSDDGPEYEIIQTGSKYTIFENGKDLQVPTIPKAEAIIRKLFPISEIEFYSRCYISTQKPYALQRDSDSDRLQHIVDIAMLDQYSAINKYFALKASSIKDNEIRLSVLEQQLATVRKKLKSTKSTLTAAEYKKLKVQYKAAATTLEKLQTERFGLTSQQQALESLLTVEKELDELRGNYKFKKAPEVQLKLLRADKKAAQSWQSYEDELATIKKAQAKINAKIKELSEQLPEATKKEIQASIKTHTSSIRNLEEQISEQEAAEELFAELNSELDEIQAEFKKTGLTTDQVDLAKDYEALVAENKVGLRLESLLEHEHDEEDTSGTCPTCQSDIDYEAIRKVVEKAKRAVAKYTKYKKAKDCIVRSKPLTKKLKTCQFDAKVLEKLKTKLKTLLGVVKTLEGNLEIIEEVASLKDQLSTLDKPEKPEAERPVLDIDDIESGIDLCHEIGKHLEAKAALLKNHKDFADFRSAKAVSTANGEVVEKIALLAKRIRAVESEQSEWAGQITAYEQHENTVKVYQGEEATALEEIAKLKPSVEDKKLVTLLTKAYGTKGLRAYAANAFCNLLQTNLNHYRDLIFAEPFEFIVEASDTGVSILVDRNNGKPDAVSDVRHLSGAESECFSLLCAASLITLTPNSRKLNMIVLDEPTSHMHQVTRELFNQKFIPFLRELVPSVFIITPHDDDTSHNSMEWVVEKSKGVSKLIQMQ